MPDPVPNPESLSSSTSNVPARPGPPSPQRGPTIHIAEEFGTAKRNLPPIKILLLTLAGVLLIAGVVSFLQRAKPQASGSLDNVVAVAIPGQTACMVALTFTLHNSPDKPLWVNTIHGKLATPSGELAGDAVSAVDFDRYFGAFPALKVNSQPALAPEDKLQPGQEIKRTVIVSFPVTLDAFNQHKSISLVIQPYDQPLPITFSK
jgi:hypothetical protein